MRLAKPTRSRAGAFVVSQDPAGEEGCFLVPPLHGISWAGKAGTGCQVRDGRGGGEGNGRGGEMPGQRSLIFQDKSCQQRDGAGL